MKTLVLLRHGQSQWNKENRFTGWWDCDLSDQGVEEAHQAGKLLKEAGFEFDIVYTNYLTRAIKTMWAVLEELDQMWLPTKKSWRLNERHYGALTGLNKSEMAAKHGEEQVHIWRRSYDIRPPPMEPGHKYWMKDDRRYKDMDPKDFPDVECLKDTVERLLPYWHEEIVPQLQAGKRVLVSCSGNSSRAIIKHLDQCSGEDIVKFNMPTGFPLVYELDDDLKPIKKYFLGDQEKVKQAQEAVIKQGTAT